jgi:hypothetical protein
MGYWLFLLALLFFALMLCRGATPPLPKAKKKLSPVPTQGSGAALLLSKPAPVAPPTTNYVRLTWTWSPDSNNPAAEVRFNVYRKTNSLSTPWILLATVSTNGWTERVDKGLKSAFFGVKATNILSGLESGWGTR